MFQNARDSGGEIYQEDASLAGNGWTLVATGHLFPRPRGWRQISAADPSWPLPNLPDDRKVRDVVGTQHYAVGIKEDGSDLFHAQASTNSSR